MRICLGDVVGIGPYQKECMELLSQYDYTMLHGNHEARITKEIDDLDPVVDKSMYSYFNYFG